MDKRGQELNELRDYGYKLLEELRYPDIISMLRDTMTHLADIAGEYSTEAGKWHNKYDECALQIGKLQEQITILTEASNGQNNSLQTQTVKFDTLKRDLGRKITELRSYRDSEIAEYGSKVQALIATQTTLDKMTAEVEANKHNLEESIRRCKEEKSSYKEKRTELENQIELNQMKLDDYQNLFDFKLNAKNQIDAVQQAADDKVDAANIEIAEWKRKYDEEHTLRVKVEEENVRLKKQLQGSMDNSTNDSDTQQGEASERQGETSSLCDDDEDGTK